MNIKASIPSDLSTIEAEYVAPIIHITEEFNAYKIKTLSTEAQVYFKGI